MNKIIKLEIDKQYADVISITFIGHCEKYNMNITNCTYDIRKKNKIVVSENGETKCIKGDSNE